MDAKEQKIEFSNMLSAVTWNDVESFEVSSPEEASRAAKAINKLIKQARNDALEEVAELAVKLTINSTFTPHRIGLAIRALKEKT